MNLLYAVIGVTLGTAVGVLPGIGPALTVALLLPVTFHLDPSGALIMFAGIYYGAMYGGSTTSILLNTPGESATIVTALDGHQMARAGRGGRRSPPPPSDRLSPALIATLGADLHGAVMVKFALAFGPAEYFALMVLAFVTVTTAFGDSRAARAGRPVPRADARSHRHRPADRASAADLRHSRSARRHRSGDALAIGLFAVGETLWVAAGAAHDELSPPVRGSVWMTRAGLVASWKPLLRGTAIGFPIGALPAGGAEIADLPVATRSRNGCRARKNSATARSKGSPGPKPRTMPRRPARWCRCSRSACRPRRRRRSCSPASSSSACSRARCSSSTNRRWSGA